jgi:hypothetical protein
MFKKINELAMNFENLLKIYVIETNIVSLTTDGQGPEKKGVKNEVNLP